MPTMTRGTHYDLARHETLALTGVTSGFSSTSTIACEISISTSVQHEMGNVEKCLAAGYDRVAAFWKKLGTRTRVGFG